MHLSGINFDHFRLCGGFPIETQYFRMQCIMQGICIEQVFRCMSNAKVQLHVETTVPSMPWRFFDGNFGQGQGFGP